MSDARGELARWEPAIGTGFGPRDRERLARRGPASMGRTEEPLRLIARAHRLTWDEMDLLDGVAARAFQRDVARTESLLPNIRQAEMATLTRRATEMVAELDGYHQVLAMTAGLPNAVVDAALAQFGAGALADPEYAMLLGPWAEVVDDDPGVLDAAFSEAADRLRCDFRWIRVEAWAALPADDSADR